MLSNGYVKVISTETISYPLNNFLLLHIPHFIANQMFYGKTKDRGVKNDLFRSKTCEVIDILATAEKRDEDDIQI